jgi:hypothetical protein
VMANAKLWQSDTAAPMVLSICSYRVVGMRHDLRLSVRVSVQLNTIKNKKARRFRQALEYAKIYLLLKWRSLGESNPCSRRERAVS